MARPSDPHGDRTGAAFRLLTLFALFLGLPADAQTLAFRRYDLTEGLPNSRVNCIFQDSRGYLWFGTWAGLSRFDGVEFHTYDAPEGKPSLLVNAIAEDAHGSLWIATQGVGVARLLDPPGEDGSHFEVHPLAEARSPNVADALLFDAQGDLWCGTEGGLFRLRRKEQRFESEPVAEDAPVGWPGLALADRRGHLWFGTRRDLIEVAQGRIVARHSLPEPIESLQETIAIVEREDGGLFVAFGQGVYAFDPGAGAGGADAWRRLPIDLAPSRQARCMLLDSRGVLWIGTTGGLFRLRDGEADLLGSANGLPDVSIRALLEDREGNLWIATWSSGALKIPPDAIVSFLEPAAMPDRTAMHLVEDRRGRIVATGRAGMACIDRDRVELVEGSTDPEFTDVGPRILLDRRGDWWIGTQHGLWRFPGPDLALAPLERGERFGPEDGLEEAAVFGEIFEDPQGRIWFGMLDGLLYEWNPRESDRPRFRRRDMEKTGVADAPRAFACDRTGRLWIAPYVGIARLQGDRFVPLPASPGLPDLQARCFFSDHLGRLWIGTRFGGASMTDDPAAENPVFTRWTKREGLESQAVWSIAEDEEGRIYLGTARGLAQIDPESRGIRHLTALDGLAGDIVSHVIRDRAGRIWAATSGGVSRYDPRVAPPEIVPPPAYLTRVQVGGEDVPLPERGVASLSDVEVAWQRNNLSIGFTAPSFRGERGLRFQYRLEGEDPGWSEPIAHRSVNYVRLAPGAYRFLVRALPEGGQPSQAPASLSFRVLPPFWRSWWFLAAATAALAAVALSLHRARVRRILALEAIRRQIATDIHDEMGSGLAQIAILSEVAKRDAPPVAQMSLDEVANLARSLRDSMSDIVWAIDPRRDRFADLVQRMRQVAFNLLEAEGLRVEFRAPQEDQLERMDLAPDKRRHLLLILKESLANVARHARASHVEIELRIEPAALSLRVQDDGAGFDPWAEHRGHGLASLRQRAAALGGTLEVRSALGKGTEVLVRVPR